MKNLLLRIVLFIVSLIILVSILYALGFVGVHYTNTLGVAQENARRNVFENTNSFTKGKEQEAIKAYKEWNSAKTPEEKKAIENIISMSLADFNEDKYIHNSELLSWIKMSKYGKRSY